MPTLSEVKDWPKVADFEKGLVYCGSDYVRDAERILDDNNYCFLVGEGGRGKTVTARAIGKHYLDKRWDIYCIDASVKGGGHIDEAATVKDIADLLVNSEGKTLFIIENIQNPDSMILSGIFNVISKDNPKDFAKSRYIFTSRQKLHIFNEDDEYNEVNIDSLTIFLKPTVDLAAKIVKNFITTNDIEYFFSKTDAAWISKELTNPNMIGKRQSVNLRNLKWYLETWKTMRDESKSNLVLPDTTIDNVLHNIALQLRRDLDNQAQDLLYKISSICQFDINFYSGISNQWAASLGQLERMGYVYRINDTDFFRCYSEDAAYYIKVKSTIRSMDNIDVCQITAAYLTEIVGGLFELGDSFFLGSLNLICRNRGKLGQLVLREKGVRAMVLPLISEKIANSLGNQNCLLYLFYIAWIWGFDYASNFWNVCLTVADSNSFVTGKNLRLLISQLKTIDNPTTLAAKSYIFKNLLEKDIKNLYKEGSLCLEDIYFCRRIGVIIFDSSCEKKAILAESVSKISYLFFIMQHHFGCNKKVYSDVIVDMTNPAIFSIKEKIAFSPQPLKTLDRLLLRATNIAYEENPRAIEVLIRTIIDYVVNNYDLVFAKSDLRDFSKLLGTALKLNDLAPYNSLCSRLIRDERIFQNDLKKRTAVSLFIKLKRFGKTGNIDYEKIVERFFSLTFDDNDLVVRRLSLGHFFCGLASADPERAFKWLKSIPEYRIKLWINMAIHRDLFWFLIHLDETRAKYDNDLTSNIIREIILVVQKKPQVGDLSIEGLLAYLGYDTRAAILISFSLKTKELSGGLIKLSLTEKIFFFFAIDKSGFEWTELFNQMVRYLYFFDIGQYFFLLKFINDVKKNKPLLKDDDNALKNAMCCILDKVETPCEPKKTLARIAVLFSHVFKDCSARQSQFYLYFNKLCQKELGFESSRELDYWIKLAFYEKIFITKKFNGHTFVILNRIYYFLKNIYLH